MVGLVIVAAALIAQDAPAAESPYRGKLLAYGGRSEGQSSWGWVYRMNPDGTGVEGVFEDRKFRVDDARLSRDGMRLALTLARTTAPHTSGVDILEPDGKLTRTNGRGSVTAWSRDGRNLVCVWREGEGWHSEILDVEAGQLHDAGLGPDDYPEDWSPTADVLAVVARRPDQTRKVVRDGETSVYPLRQIDLCPLIVPGRRRLTPDPATDNIWSRFSPDGRSLIHYRRRVVDVDGPERYRAYERFVIEPVEGAGETEVFACSRLGADLRATQDDLPYPFYWTVDQAVWSPDGGRIALIANNLKWHRWSPENGQSPVRFALVIVTADGRLERAVDLGGFARLIDWR